MFDAQLPGVCQITSVTLNIMDDYTATMRV